MSLLGPTGQPAAPAPAPEPAAKEITVVTTAFIVYQLPNGVWLISPDLNEPLAPMRPPSMYDIYGGVTNVQADIAAQRAASLTIGTLQQQAQAAAQRQLTPEEAAALQAAMRGGRG